MTYDFSIFPSAVESRARAKRRYILRRYGDPDGIVATDAYLYGLCEEELDRQVVSAMYDGRQHSERYA